MRLDSAAIQTLKARLEAKHGRPRRELIEQVAALADTFLADVYPLLTQAETAAALLLLAVSIREQKVWPPAPELEGGGK